VYVEALTLVQEEADSLLVELAGIWRIPVLSPEEAEGRAAETRLRLRPALGPILEGEKARVI
jgi:hypothetical protein